VNLKEDDLMGKGILTMTLGLNLAKQIRSLMANVQNLTRIVQELSTTGNPNTNGGNIGGVANEKRTQLEKRSYA